MLSNDYQTFVIINPIEKNDDLCDGEDDDLGDDGDVVDLESPSSSALL